MLRYQTDLFSVKFTHFSFFSLSNGQVFEQLLNVKIGFIKIFFHSSDTVKYVKSKIRVKKGV